MVRVRPRVVEAAGLSPEVVSPTDSADAAASPAPGAAPGVLGARPRALLAHGIEPIGDWGERWQAPRQDVRRRGRAEPE